MCSGRAKPSATRVGEPGRNRTFNQQIKSLLLCQLSYGPTRRSDAHDEAARELTNREYIIRPPSIKPTRRGLPIHQITRTRPDSRITASRVTSGIAIVTAVATMSASNGSRVSDNSSATSTCSGVRSSG